MAEGPGKYDVECTAARLTCEAKGVVLVVLDGCKGSGFSVQMPVSFSREALAAMLEHVAQQIRGAR